MQSLNGFFCKILVVLFAFALFSLPAFAKKTNQAVYEEPFDLAGGGASLTRASQEGVMFANPAMMPYGGKFLRWLGYQISLLTNKESVEMLQNLSRNKKDSSGEEEDQSKFVEKTFTNPIHFGVSTALSVITNNVGFAAFGRFEPDIKGEKHNSTGIPVLRARAELYYGGILAGGYKITRWLSVGAATKYLYVAEPDISVNLADQEKIKSLQDDPQALKNETDINNGVGFDAGALFFLQGYNLDYRLALKADDVGGTTFGGVQEPFKQTLAAGLGITLHNAVDSIHLCADFRDILGAYGEPWPMRTYAGAKLILRNYVGLSAGLYQGYPSYGVRIDMLLFKIGATVYTREMGEYPGDDPRSIYMAYFGIGF